MQSTETAFAELELVAQLISHPEGGGVPPYMGYIGMCGPKGYGFSAFLVIDRISILTNFAHKWSMVFAL